MQLSSRRCPHTGVVNFYAVTDPHIAIGSIARCGTAADVSGFAWRCYTAAAESSGRAPDLKTAERRLTNFYAMVEQSSPEQH